MRTLRKQWGLTLIELMITLVVLAILSAIAYPLYETQTRKARRVEAKAALMGIALAQERILTRTGSYGTADQLGEEYTELVDRMTDQDGAAGPDYYAIVITPENPTTTFTVTATAQGIQGEDTDCAEFSVNQLGQRLSEKSDGSDSTETCW